MKNIFILVCFILLISSIDLSFGNEYYVILEGGGGQTCPSNDGLPCNTLSFYMNQSSLYFTDNTIFYFLEGTHLLNSTDLITLSDVSNITLQGMGSTRPGFHETVRESTVYIKCTNTSGLVFEDSEDIVISMITVSECGGITVGVSSSQLYLSLGFDSTHNIRLEQVSVLNGTGTGLYIRNSYGVSIKDSSFSHNVIPPCDTEVLCPGGNLHMLYYNETEALENNSTISIEIVRSNFSLGYSTEYAVSGGIALTITLETFVNLNILFNEVVVLGNTAILSPNIQIGLTCPVGIAYDIVINNTVSTYGNAIVAPPQSLLDIIQINSGGLQIFDQSQGHTKARLSITNSEFSHSDVYNYGGLQLSFLSDTLNNILDINIENCVIRNNTGDVGAGVFIFVSRSLGNTLPSVVIRNTTIEGNHLNVGYDQLFGAVLIQNVNATLSQVLIADNTATGLISLASIVTFVSMENMFRNNSGINGGGMALYESSFLVFQPPVYVSFIDNLAASRGGGIYVGQVTITTNIKTSCFYQLHDDNSSYIGRVQVFFNGNEANQSGSAVYGGNINNCLSGIRFPRVFNYTLQSGSSVISSDATGICYCNSTGDGRPDCLTFRRPVSVYPGQMFTIPVAAVGQFDGITTGVLQLTDYTTSTPTTTFETLSSKCNMVSYVTQLSNDQQSSLQVYLTLDGLRDPRSAFGNKLLEVSVLPCPPGFSFDARLGWCQCDALIFRVRNVECNVTTELMTREGNVWMGYDTINNCTYVREDCPFSYCFPNQVTFDILNPNPQCALNRSGIMCGGCAEGLSLMLGSDQCGECSNVYILLIIVFALAGIGLVALLIALNLTVSLGTINGLIFYANIIKINEEILIPGKQLPVLTQFISWINLDFGIQTCFYDGMTALDKAWLHFVFPVYIWLIIIALIVLAYYFSKVSKLLGNNAVPVLSTLMLLAYAKIFRSSINAFNGAVLDCGSEAIHVWYIDPNVLYNDPSHIVLVAIAAVFLFFLALPFTLVLLFNRPLAMSLNSEKCRKCGCHGQKLGLRLFFEAFNSPYKPDFTFWTGLLLLVRFITVFVVAFTTNEHHAMATAILITFLVILQAAIGGVYESKFLNILETLFLFKLLIILIVATTSSPNTTVIITGISITLALIAFIGIIVFHVLLRLGRFKVFQSTKSKIENFVREKRKGIMTDEVTEVGESGNDIGGHERTVSSTSIELRRRETLLSHGEEELEVRSSRSSKAFFT